MKTKEELIAKRKNVETEILLLSDSYMNTTNSELLEKYSRKLVLARKELDVLNYILG